MCRNEKVEVERGCLFADPDEELGEEGLFETGLVRRQYEADHLRPTPTQPLCRHIGHVFETPGGVLDSFPGQLGHVVEATKGTRRGGDRHPGLFRHIDQSNLHDGQRPYPKRFGRVVENGEEIKKAGRTAEPTGIVPPGPAFPCRVLTGVTEWAAVLS